MSQKSNKSDRLDFLRRARKKSSEERKIMNIIKKNIRKVGSQVKIVLRISSDRSFTVSWDLPIMISLSLNFQKDNCPD